VGESAVWKRLDRPGRDAALLQARAGGWLLRGAVAFDHELGPAAVAYEVQVNARLETTRGVLSGFLGEATVRHEILRDKRGWRLDGVEVDGMERLVDLDYGFTPATNVLQLMRMSLPPGETAELPVAWFDLDSMALTELPQTTNAAGMRPIGMRPRRFPIGRSSKLRRTASSSPTRVSGAWSPEGVTPAPPAAR
jgi:uncharacterized protein